MSMSSMCAMCCPALTAAPQGDPARLDERMPVGPVTGIVTSPIFGSTRMPQSGVEDTGGDASPAMAPAHKATRREDLSPQRITFAGSFRSISWFFQALFFVLGMH